MKKKGIVIIGLIIIGISVSCLLIGTLIYQGFVKNKRIGLENSSTKKEAGQETPKMEIVSSNQSVEPEVGKMNPKEEIIQTVSENQKTEELEDQIEEKLSQMTLEQKVAQMFLITPESLTGSELVTQAGDMTKESLKKFPVGGLIYFGANIIDKEQLRSLTANTQEYAKSIMGIPILLGIDEEGGRVARIGSNEQFPVKRFDDMAVIGATGDISKAYEAGNVIGNYLNDYGFNIDFAPDSDVLSNSANTVIGTRSFGNDPALVADMSINYLEGLHESGIYGCPKHFPGHGATEGDTHEGFAYTDKTWEELKSCELIPFQQEIDNGVSFIMVAHISLPNILNDNTPASLSKEIVTEKLRNEMGYEGVITTDSLGMGAISNTYPSDQAALMAVESGVDLLMMPKDFRLAYHAIIDAVKSGKISEERIDESVRRILDVKLSL
ncbi:MAG: glycoside hydrolase family 3 N-terminal domain-containing protein [Lachnospiraceae bacterium]|nr:glycoside hydrolase family 3 N-terminal domain-containing protein [Lachnospiraceae bacterium]